ncbi:MAG: DUF4097 family beta strand repeat-containing protein [Betaproteobacteria bacterium]
MKRGLFAAALSAALGLSGCIDGGFGHLAAREHVDVSKPLSAGGRFSLENTNGSVRVATWGESRVRIEAEKAAASESALRRIEVAVEGEGDRVEVRTRLPHGHWFGGGGKVDYTITVPRGASVSLRNVNGRIEVQDVDGELHAQNVNGSLDATDLGGTVEATTVNGSVEVRMARVSSSSHNRISSTNGRVRLTLPSDTAADVEASVVNGSVHCDFDLQGEHKTRRKIEGRIGTGGARFELRTVNGSAHIDRGLSSASASATPAPPVEAQPSRGR